jgi:site-specific DNA recombinase
MLKKNSSYKIGIYIRVSTEDQAANPEGSLKSQEQRLRQQVTQRNQDGDFGKIVRVFVDRAKSGKDTNRPELQKLLKAIREKEVTLVLVTELSRLSRSIRDFCTIWDLMRENACDFQSLREQFDTTTPAGELLLFNMAGLAQFERRQIGERVAANFLARAQRGLYNGGSVPFGYRIEPEKKGHLFIDPEGAKVIRAAFATFLQERTLKAAGQKLNENGYKLARHIQGGGRRSRLGHFTTDNLYHILINKMYTGQRVFKVKDQEKTVKAVWDAIIDEPTFNRVNEILKKNFRKVKRSLKRKYPYLLSGLLVCGTCRDALCGKSANGNGGMIPYYEHAWLTKKQSCLNKKVFECKPNRVLCKLIEPAVWNEVIKVISGQMLAKSIVDEAHRYHRDHNHVPEQERLQSKVAGIDGQIEALAEHLANIPKGISPGPIFSQMQKLEAIKKQVEGQRRELEESGEISEMPVELKTYQAFMLALSMRLEHQSDAIFKQKVIQRLIHKIELLPDGLKIHWFAGDSRFVSFNPKRGSSVESKPTSTLSQNENGGGHQASPASFFVSGSNTLDIGWGGRIRTSEWQNQNLLSYHLTTPQCAVNCC